MINGWASGMFSQLFRHNPPRLRVQELKRGKKRALPASCAPFSDSFSPSCILAQIPLRHVTFGTLPSAVTMRP